MQTTSKETIRTPEKRALLDKPGNTAYEMARMVAYNLPLIIEK